MGEAVVRYEDGCVRWTAATSYSSGEVVRVPDGRAGVIAGLKAVVSGDAVAAQVEGEFDFAKASGTVFGADDPVYWDASANQAVLYPTHSDDFYLGMAVAAGASGALVVRVALNKTNIGMGRGSWATYAQVLDHADAAEYVVVRAEDNKNGLLVHSFHGVVTEQPAGSSEDQLILGLYDEDDNQLSAMTTTDSSPDAAGDLVVGTRTLMAGTTGVVAAVIPAGKAAYVKVAQATAGTPAGAVRVQAVVGPLL